MRATLALDGLINTHSQKLGYTLKLFTLVDTLDCNFLGITNTKISINHKLPSHHNLTFFCGKDLPLTIFLENRKNLNSHPVGEISFDSLIPLASLLCYYK